jgi:Zn-dependent protease with chaperone function
MGDESIAWGNLPALATRVQRFPGISSRAYEHPADTAAILALKKLPGVDTAIKKLYSMYADRSYRMAYLASAVRTSERQFAPLHDILRSAADTLDLDRVPEMYIRRGPDANASTIGANEPFIVLTTGLVDMMDEDELRFVIGHELGHAMSAHAVYHTMAQMLVVIGAVAASVPLGGITIQAVQLALEEWSRKSELSSDRAGLLVSQDPGASLRALMKLAGGAHMHEMNVAEFLAQAEEFGRIGDLRDNVIRLMLTKDQSHPLLVVRVGELHRWALSDDYEDILCGDYALRTHDSTASFTKEARETAGLYVDKVKGSTEPLLSSFREKGASALDRGGRMLPQMRRKQSSEPTDPALQAGPAAIPDPGDDQAGEASGKF